MAKKLFPLVAGAALGAAGVYAVASARAAERTSHVPVNRFDPQLQPLARAFRADPLARSITPAKLRWASPLSQRLKMPAYPGLSCRTAQVRGRSGAFDVQIIEPEERVGVLPVVEWLHGGGFALDSSALEMDLIAGLIAACPSIFVVPAYRLSPQAPAPAAAEDAYDTLIWIKENHAQLGARSDQIFVGGYSAGGGLACAVTLMARDWGKVNVAFQMPIAPMLDDRMLTASSRNNDAPWWNTQANIAAWQLYLGDAFDTDQVSAYEAPGRCTDFAGLPPAYSYVGSLEPFADEALAYFSQLREAGGEAAIEVYPRCFHGFDLLVPDAAVSQEVRTHLYAAFRRAVDSHFAANDEA